VDGVPGALGRNRKFDNRDSTEERSMSKQNEMMTKFAKLGLILMMGVSMSACSSSDTWKEEVLLHDGSKIVVERTQHFGGNHEFIQRPPIKEHTVKFTLPGSNKPVTWKSEFSEDVGHSNFSILALDIINGSAYVVAYPTNCLAYNKWGRPNPPYIIFKYIDDQWKQIELAELPTDINRPNILINTYGYGDADRAVKSGFIAAESVKKLNGELTQQELKNIVRVPIKSVDVDCGVMVHYKCGWAGANSDGTINKDFMDHMCK
jgi:hypothetical protein